MGYSWASTIYAVFNNEALKDELNKWALLKGVKVIYGDPDSEDIIMRPYFAAILDRHILSDKMYKFYLHIINEVNNPIDDIKLMKEMGMSQKNLSELGYRDDHLCIFIDDIKDKPYPKLDLIMQVGFEYPDSIPWIINNLEFRKSQAT